MEGRTPASPFLLFLLLHCLLLTPTLHARSGFTLLAPSETGIVFTNLLAEQRHLTNQIFLNGSGVAAGDVDGDGRCDLFFARLDGSSALYRNLGAWKFEDATTNSGVALSNSMSTGCALADLDGDADLDLVVNSLGQGTRLFYNNGKGEFQPHPTLLNPGKAGMSLAVGDLDGDGWLDLYIPNYRSLGLMDIPNARATFKRVDGKTVVETFNGRPVTAPDLTNRFSIGPRGAMEENGEADAVYRNVGGTNFVLVSWTGGNFLDENGRPLEREPFDWGLSAAIRDLNGDGFADIYVCNDFQTPDRLWLGQGGGKFRLATRETLRKTSMFSMSIDFADLNRDGFDDFFVADMLSRSHAQRMKDMTESAPPELFDRPQYNLNTLFLNRGDGTFGEIARFAGLDASDWTWSCIFLDVDLDGWDDVLISNGMERAARDLDVAARLKAMRAARPLSDSEVFQARRMFPRLATRNYAFRNRGDLTFEETGAAWGFDLPGVSQGGALADLDNDGDLDVVLNNLNAAAAVYRNDADAPRVTVRLRGSGPNTQGIGARIVVRGGEAPPQSQTVAAGGRYLSSDEPLRAFAAGTNAALSVEVHWASGRRSLAQARPGEIALLSEPDGPVPPRPSPVQAAPLFEDVSSRIPFEHVESDFDDYARQPLLPFKLSEAGPGAAWHDLDGDGWDELLLGASRGGAPVVFRNLRNGAFQPADSSFLKTPLQRDLGAILGWRGAPGRGYVLAGLSNYEDGQTTGAAVRQFDPVGNSGGDIVAAAQAAPGPIALADVDGDGDLDLFIGSGPLPGKYPLSGASRLFRNNGARLDPDANNAAVLAAAGLVNSAVFSDLDGDKDPDLALACDWGPIRILRNDKGAFSDATAEFGLDKLLGRWNGLAAADFDGDGSMDLAAGNWGLNTSPLPTQDHPLRIWHDDFDGDGTYDLIEANYEPELRSYAPLRNWPVVSKSLDFVRQSFPSNAAYSTATVETLLGDKMQKAKVAEANWLSSTVFLSRGGRFEPRALPPEAQFSPAIGVCAADFDGDGREDLALSQNFFPLQPEIPRQDAGRGLLLLGDGRGGFRAVPGQESGLRVYGEQRGIAASDFDGDGRTDLVITQNGGAAKLYRNTAAKPALRVSLLGSAANPDGIGATVRALSNGTAGRRREIHSSSGWFAQDSRVQLLAVSGAAKIEIRWPDGLEETVDVPAGVKQVRLKRDN